MKKIFIFSVIFILILVICLIPELRGGSNPAAEITELSIGYLTESTYNNGDYAETSITENPSSTDREPQYMVIDCRIKTLVNSSEAQSLKLEVRALTDFAATVTLQEAPTGKFELVEGEDGSMKFDLFYTIAANKNDEKTVRTILKLIPNVGGDTYVTISVSGDDQTEITGKTYESQKILFGTSNFKFARNQDGTYRVSLIGTYSGEEIVFPSAYNGKPVTGIASGELSDSGKLKSIVIPDSVTSIGDSAFSGYVALTDIAIPAGVTHIGDRAFQDCGSLTDIVIPDGVTGIGDWAFYGCRSLTDMIIPGGVTHIGDYVFEDCSSLTSIVIPGGVTHIGDYAFRDCISLTGIAIPESVTSIGDYAFENCDSLTDIVIPGGVASMGNGAIRYCSRLTNVTISNGVTNIGWSAFSLCSSLKSVVIPAGVTVIDDYAFENCSSLTSITYGGTKAQWNAISFGADWNKGTGNYTVICTDGAISKN